MWDLLKPGAAIIWSDFVYDNPDNKAVRAVPMKRVRALFPWAKISFRRIRLAPPISRRVCAINPRLYWSFNRFPFLRSHVLCWIEKPVSQSLATPAGKDGAWPIELQRAASVSSNPGCLVRPATQADVAGIVGVHVAGFPGFFLSILGSEFLAVLYDTIVGDRNGILLVAVIGGEIKGFVGGVLDTKGFYRRLFWSRPLRLTYILGLKVLRNGRIASRLARTVRTAFYPSVAMEKACLMSIAVDPAVRGRGIGKALVAEFSRQIGIRGGRSYYLTTDRLYNEATNQFYRSNGFALQGRYLTPDGREMNCYVISIKD